MTSNHKVVEYARFMNNITKSPEIILGKPAGEIGQVSGSSSGVIIFNQLPSSNPREFLKNAQTLKSTEKQIQEMHEAIIPSKTQQK